MHTRVVVAMLTVSALAAAGPARKKPKRVTVAVADLPALKLTKPLVVDVSPPFTGARVKEAGTDTAELLIESKGLPIRCYRPGMIETLDEDIATFKLAPKVTIAKLDDRCVRIDHRDGDIEEHDLDCFLATPGGPLLCHYEDLRTKNFTAALAIMRSIVTD